MVSDLGTMLEENFSGKKFVDPARRLHLLDLILLENKEIFYFEEAFFLHFVVS